MILRLLHQVMLQLHRNDFKPECALATPKRGPSGTTLRRVSESELWKMLGQAGWQRLVNLELRLTCGVLDSSENASTPDATQDGWQGLSDPLVFDAPRDLKLPYACREELLPKDCCGLGFLCMHW